MGQFGAIQAMASSLKVDVSPVNVRDRGEIERVISTFARGSNSGLIVTRSALSVIHRDLINHACGPANCLLSISNATLLPLAG